VIDARTSAPLAGVSVRIAPVDDSTLRSIVTSSNAGRFPVRLGRQGAYELVARRPSFATVEMTLLITTDTPFIDVAMTRLAQPLGEVTVRATEPRAIMIRIDGGPLEPFDAVRNRALADFAAFAIVGGGFVLAYTKDYAASKRRELNAGR
jgi:hypothetical protein